MHWLVISQQNKIGYYTYTCLFICDVLINFCGHFLLYLSIYPFILFLFNCIINRPIFLDIFENLHQHFSKSSLTFPGKFTNIPRNLLQHSRNVKIITLTESSKRFPGIVENIPRVSRIPFSVPVFLVL